MNILMTARKDVMIRHINQGGCYDMAKRNENNI